MTVSPAEHLAFARAAACVFQLTQRGVIEVRGEDRERWLDGMVSNEVTGLEAAGERTGCYALLLTRTGRIVADLHVLARPQAYWLELEAALVPKVVESLDRYIVADDVELADVSEKWRRFAVEGPRAPALFAALAGDGAAPPADGAGVLRVAGAEVAVGAYPLAGGPGFQLFAPAASADAVNQAQHDAVAEALVAASQQVGGSPELAPDEALEVLRIEDGVPRGGAELDEEVLPQEAHLERAVSTTKGCYTGQEIVARLRSRGQVKHHLVALRFDSVPAVGDALFAGPGEGERKVGEVTSVCQSPERGAIGLGYARVGHAEAGASLALPGGGRALVAPAFGAPGSVPDEGAPGSGTP